MNTASATPPNDGRHDLAGLSLDLDTLEQAYRHGGLTPLALVEELERRALVTVDDKVWLYRLPLPALRDAAQALQQRAARGEVLPLYGLPFGVKDNIDVAGLPTTAACEALRYTATRTAAVVEKLQAAGALLIGKQNMDQFATGLVGVRSPSGHCRNPFNPDLIPGGSSSGSAVAVATGQASFSIGSDTGGSGRVPAALNNIVGLKPTPGLVSTYGFLYNNRTFDVAPVFALTTGDALQVLDVIAGHDERDPWSVIGQDWRKSANTLRERFRFGLPAAQHLEFFGDLEAKAQFERALSWLQMLGGEPMEIDFSAFAEARSLVFDSPLVAERWIDYGATVESHPDAVHPAVRQSLRAGRNYNAQQAFECLYRLESLKRRAWSALKDVDALVLPTAATIYRCDQVEAQPQALNTNMGYYTYFANPLQLSAISVPAGLREDGLPFGLSFIGLPFADLRVAALAQRFHARIGGMLGATAAPNCSGKPY
ncbi:allophanate hydrolase [Lacisediminimonas profundi]|uniref:allophanate hydrolase n=1 Tax=Lacisediminimonas profundi TaxID=2603856 RepID=UPI00124BC491|nr:allophanate hydrolase [Lacisediminimonas profundi]